MSEGTVSDILKEIQDDLAVVKGIVDTLVQENELLRKRIVQLTEGSDDLADAAEDRERDAEFAKSEAWQDRGARD